MIFVDHPKFSNLILYAGDTNIFYSCGNLNQLCEVVNQELLGVMQWFRANRLSVNLKKTNFVFFWILWKDEKD